MKRVRPAKDYQRPDAPIRLLAIHGRAAIRRDMKASLSHLEALVDPIPITYRIKVGAYDQVKDVIAWNHWREVLPVPFERIAQLFEAAAQLGVRKINGSFDAKQRRVSFTNSRPYRLRKADIGERFNFNRFDQTTLDRLRDAQDVLIQQLTTEARDTVDTVVLNGVREGLEPSAIVDDIRNLIGLTDTQAQAVLNYRRMLEEGDLTALTRQLRDPSLDAALRQSILDVSNNQALVDRAVRAYEDNYLDYRANNIATTESVRAANAGLHDSYRQAIDRGALPADAIRRYWQISLNENVCPICTSIPDMNPDGVMVGEDFQSIDGPYNDAPVHPHCECSVEYVTDLDQVPEE